MTLTQSLSLPIDMQVAPLWDAVRCQFVGLLSVCDFIDILRHYKQTRADVSTLSTKSIATILNDPQVRQLLGREQQPSASKDDQQQQQQQSKQQDDDDFFWSADTTTSLKQACRMLHDHNMDFLPVLYPEDMRILACITYTNILEHLVTHFREQRRLFDDSIYELGIGTYHDKFIKANPTQTLAEALELMHQHGLSAIPVVDNSHGDYNKLVGVYSRSDISFLASASDAENALANLDLPLETVLSQQRTDVTTPDALHTCSRGHTLQSIFEYFAQLRFNRLFVLDEKESVVGVVSARDLVAYFLEEK